MATTWTFDHTSDIRYLVSRDDAAATTTVQEQRFKEGGWTNWNGMTWPVEVMVAASRAIRDTLAGVPEPAIPKPYAALTVDQYSTVRARRFVEIKAKRVLAVFHHGGEDNQQIMLREYKRTSGWQIHGYLSMPIAIADKLATALLA